MSGPNWSHPSKDQGQTKNETENPAKLHQATDSGVLGIDPGLAVGPASQLLQTLQRTNPEHPTHWDPSVRRLGHTLLILKVGKWLSAGFLRAAGGRLWHGCAVLTAARMAARRGLTFGLSRCSRRIFGRTWRCISSVSQTEGVCGRTQPKSEPFFTERTLAAYLAVSDRTIRNWIRRGELPSYKLGASRRIDPADVDAFLEARREEAA